MFGRRPNERGCRPSQGATGRKTDNFPKVTLNGILKAYVGTILQLEVNIMV
jgi:hypothetical protein